MENMNSNRKCGELIFAKSPQNFWIRLEEYKNDYTSMLGQLQAEYQNGHQNPDLAVTHLQLGSKYCTFNQQLFEWHRCEILVVNKSDVFISYIDTGRTDLIPLKSIKKLVSTFHTQPPFALHCTLHGVKPSHSGSWSNQSIQEFTKLTVNKTVTLNIRSKVDNVYHVDLFVKNVSLAEHLVKQGFGQCVQADSAVQQRIANATIDNNLMAYEKQAYDVTVSTISSPVSSDLEDPETVKSKSIWSPLATNETVLINKCVNVDKFKNVSKKRGTDMNTSPNNDQDQFLNDHFLTNLASNELNLKLNFD